MPVIIRELVVKATIQDQPSTNGKHREQGIEEVKQEIRDECLVMIMEALELQKER